MGREHVHSSKLLICLAACWALVPFVLTALVSDGGLCNLNINHLTAMCAVLRQISLRFVGMAEASHQLALPPERLQQIDNVFMPQAAQHLDLSQGGLPHSLIICMQAICGAA